ncbi:hypothetical protein PoB_001942100 [Plakobranchus ocellatus]|uniref:GRIP domain-containing protein n=1 Tax=Plakobranchus ocellatus TaxID=259542 RepID=A0AAV3Z0R6_9GAST|nr:hypothetical protein PoB_001942100 [Plakobranchus ocellatus]
MERLHYVAKLTLKNLNPTLAKLCAKTKQPRAHLIGLLDMIEEVGLKVAPEDWQNLRAFLLKEDLETDTSRNKCPHDNGDYDRAYRLSLLDDRVDASAAHASTSNELNETDSNVEIERMAETEHGSEEDLDSDSSTSVESDEESSSISSRLNSDTSTGSKTRQSKDEAKRLNTLSQIIRQIESMFAIHSGIVSLINLTDENDRWSNLDFWNVNYDFEAGDDDFQYENERNKFADVEHAAIYEKAEDNSGAGVDGQNPLFIDHVRSAYRKWRSWSNTFDSTLYDDNDFFHIFSAASRTESFDGKPHLISSRSRLKESASDLKSAGLKNKVEKKKSRIEKIESKMMPGAKTTGFEEVLSEHYSSSSSDRGLDKMDVTDDFERSEINLSESSKRLDIRSDRNVTGPSGSETDDDLPQDRLDLGSKKPSQLKTVHSEHPERIDVDSVSHITEPTGSQVDQVKPLKRSGVASESNVSGLTGSEVDHVKPLKRSDVASKSNVAESIGSEVDHVKPLKRSNVASKSNVAESIGSEIDHVKPLKRSDVASESNVAESIGSGVDHVKPLKRSDVASESYVAKPAGSESDHAEVLKDQDIDRDDLQKKISHAKSLHFEDAGPSRTKIGHSEHTVRLAKSSEKQSVKPGYSMSSIRAQQQKPADRDAVQKYLAKHEIYELFQMMLTSLIVETPEKPIDFLINMARTMNQDIKIKKGMMTSVILSKARRRMEKKSI